MLGQVADAFFGDHDVRLAGYDLSAHVFDPLLFHPQQHVPIVFVGDLHVGLGLTCKVVVDVASGIYVMSQITTLDLGIGCFS